jgi:two-component system nitrogen regulation sensor histidine kinase GlnL
MIGNRCSRLAAQIEITDCGDGISPELIGHIFMPMVSTKPRGTGLGLCIAQNLINQHDGLIECSSRPGETTFTVTLPLENRHG